MGNRGDHDQADQGLAVYLRKLKGQVCHGINVPDEFVPRELARAQARIARKLGDITPKSPSPFDLEETLHIIRSTMRLGQPLTNIPRLHLRRATWVIFYPPQKKQSWLGAEPGFSAKYQAWLKEDAPASTIASLLQVFLKTYPTDYSTFESWRQCLEQLLKKSGSVRLNRWRERQEKYRLLDADGCERFAKGILKVDEHAVNKHLESAGFTGDLANSRFLEMLHNTLLDETRKRLASRKMGVDALQRVIEFCTLEKGVFRFPELKAKVADSLLLPFMNISPNLQIQDLIRRYLLDCLGHPRISPAHWHHVNANAREVMIRWLVGTTLKNFFELIAKTALDHHWSYRQAFWWAYHERHLITDAWIVLGPDTKNKTFAFFNEDDSLYGEFSNNQGVLSSHSALILKVGGLIVTEWSHNGTCRIWQAQSKKTPELGLKYYSRDDLVSRANYEQRHHASEYGTWQYQLSEWIRKQTGIRISEKEYMP